MAMTKAEVLTMAKAREDKCICVQQIEPDIAQESMTDRFARFDRNRKHMDDLVADGKLKFIKPKSGELERWEVI